MRCEKVQQKLDPYAADELTAKAREQVEAHLSACEACRKALARQRELAALLRGVPASPVPEGFHARLMAAACARVAAPQKSVSVSRIPWRWWTSVPVPMRLAAAAVMAISLSLGALMGRDVARGVAAAPSESAQVDPTAVYNLDVLADAPSGSLAEAYLALASAQTQERE